MANPDVTYTFANSTTADATEVNTNFTDLINSLTDGTKSLTIDALTAGGAAAFSGNVTLGNATTDTITFTGYVSSNIIPSADASYTLANATNSWISLYLDNGATDGRAVYFNGETATFLKGTADGNRLDTGGFTSVRLDTCALEVYNSATKASINSSGEIAYAGAYTPEWLSNVGFVNYTTSETDDSILIQGAGGSSFSTSNPGHVTLPGSTPGELTTAIVTADVAIDLTGAHWGLGTGGDETDAILCVYVINNNGSLAWGISLRPDLTTILNTDSSTTQTSVTAWGDMLVNTALASGTWNCRRIGYFKANFDDTGGASEDLWAVQSGAGDIVLTSEIPVNNETKENNESENAWPVGTSTYGDESTLVLTPGIWELMAEAKATNSGSTTAGLMRFGIGETSGDNAADVSDFELDEYNTGTSGARWSVTLAPKRVTVTATKSYYLKIRADAASLSGYLIRSAFRAHRIL